MKFMLVLAASVCTFAQIERPSLGLMLDQDNDVRPLFGTLASATPGDAILHGVLSLDGSARRCLAKTATQLVSASGQSVDAPPGPAIFGGGYVYFPYSRQLARWRDGSLEAVPFTADGEVLALRPAGGGLDYAVERDGATWIEHVGSGLRVINDVLPEAHAAMLLDSLTLLAADDGVHAIRPDGSETVLPVPGVQSFLAMSDHAIEFVAPQGRWGFELATGQLWLLPGVAP